MSYIRAEEVLPKELIEAIQQFVNGKAIYIPSVGRRAWGSETDTRTYLQERNLKILEAYRKGLPAADIAEEFSLSVKSIQRIIRKFKASGNKGEI